MKSPSEVSWVGECPWTNTRCYGEDDGQFRIEAPGSHELGERQTRVKKLATDAINAVAFAGDFIALSSRNEVVIGKRTTKLGIDLDLYPHGFIGGAHGIVASGTGKFLAPIGDQGLLMLKLEDNLQGIAQIGAPQGDPLNFYKLVRLGKGPHDEAFAAAARCDGLLALNFANGISFGPMIHHHFEGHDIVDVCPLNDPHYPLAVACVSRNRVIFLIRNVLEDQIPLILNVAGIQGTAYTLLSAQGHLFLLTDRDLVALPGVGSRYIRGEPLDCPLEIKVMPVNAAEAFLLRDRFVLLIEEDSTVSEFLVTDLVGDSAGSDVHTEPARNGRAGPEILINVTPIERSVQLVPIESGWRRTSEFALISTPAA